MAKIQNVNGKEPPVLVMKSKSFLHENRFILLSFLVPFLLMTVAFAVYDIAPFGIFRTMYESVAYRIGEWFPALGIDIVPNTAKPWGENQMLVVDLWHQYYPFLYDLHEKLQQGGSLFWTWSVGMGSNFIAMMSYYLLSPLNFLSVIIPDDALVGYLAVATVIKICCAGMFTAICLKIIFKRNDLALVIFSAMFAMCSFNMGYYWCTIWLDSVAMLPLVVAGTVVLLREGKFKLFTISLACAVVFNYYIGLFICIAVFFTAVGYTVSRFENFRKSLKDLLRTAICSVMAILMTAPVTIPAFLALQNCYKQKMGMPKDLAVNIGTDDLDGIFDATVKIFSNFISFLSPTSKEGLPNVACGLLCVILAAVFLCARKVKISEKIFCSVTLLFLVASFIFRQLDFMWHGFHFPNMLPYRFSFLVSFLLVYMAYRAYLLIDHKSYIDIAIAFLVFVLIILPSVFTLCGVTEVPLLDEEHVTKPAVIASIALGVIMIAILLLYTLKVLPRRVVSIILCVLVLGEMCATGIIGVDEVSTTTRNGYPKDSKNVARVVSHIDKWEKEGTPDWARTEVSTTQTLNDGALNGYNGISVFNSMANVGVTSYVEYLGATGWKAGNRYTYYESSPVTNVILNLKYLMVREGDIYNTSYMQEIDNSGNIRLFENQTYIPMGFMMNSSMADYTVEETVTNPFENQIEFWREATGIEEPVYKQLKVKDQGHTSSDVLSVSKTSEGMYYLSPKNSTASTHTKFNYYLEEDAMVLTYYYVGPASGSGAIHVNDQAMRSINVKQPFIACAGEYKAGDKISLFCNLEQGKGGNARVFCYTLNKEVFEQGMEILSKNHLVGTKATDTVLEGTINVENDGLMYTSIPYEKGWSVYVDGKKAEVVAIGGVRATDEETGETTVTPGGVCGVMLTKGSHTVKFSYVPDGFVIGMAAFIFSVLLFAAFCLCTSKKFRESENVAVKSVVWLFDPKVKERPKNRKSDDELDGETGDGSGSETDGEFTETEGLADGAETAETPDAQYSGDAVSADSEAYE